MKNLSKSQRETNLLSEIKKYARTEDPYGLFYDLVFIRDNQIFKNDRDNTFPVQSLEALCTEHFPEMTRDSTPLGRAEVVRGIVRHLWKEGELT